MSEEKMAILKMLEEGKITADDAVKLLEQVSEEKSDSRWKRTIDQMEENAGIIADQVGERWNHTFQGIDSYNLKRAAEQMKGEDTPAEPDVIVATVKSSAREASAAGKLVSWKQDSIIEQTEKAATVYVHSMLCRINEQIGIHMEDAEVGALAEQIIHKAALMVVAHCLSPVGRPFIYVNGQHLSTAHMAGICYVMVYLSGIVYLKTANRWLKEQVTDSDGTDEMIRIVEEIMKSGSISDDLREAKLNYGI